MNTLNLLLTIDASLYANPNDFGTDNRAWVPELWAQESLMVLEENLVMGNLVYRDFENTIQEFGDVVNTRRPGKFYATRKIDGDTTVKQASTAVKVPVILNQHVISTFIIHDVERSKAFKDLVTEYLAPAVHSVARTIDSVLIAQRYGFMANSVGKLGTAPTKATVLAAQTKADNMLIPQEGRFGIVTAASKGDILSEAQFTDADKFGDNGTAIRLGSLGLLYGTNYIMSQNNPTIEATTTVTGAVNNSSGYAAGSTSITVDGFTGALTAGSWCTIAGDMTPQKITARSNNTGGNTIGITISPGLKYAVINDAAVTVYTPGAVNLSGGYAANYAKLITVSGFSSNAPKTGQMISFGAGAYSNEQTYGSLHLQSGGDAETTLFLDKPLGAAISNSDVVGVGPAGNFNFVFHRNALALVSRPLALPPAGMGVLAAIANYNGLSVRITMHYDGDLQATVVSVDTLIGVKILDTNLGFVMYG